MTRLAIACAVDMSDCSRRALQYAGALADHFGARLAILHVNQSGVVGSVDDPCTPEAQVREFVAVSLPGGTDCGPGADIVLRQGHPGREILAFVRARQADLLVMGIRGRTGIQAAFLGSTTEHALRRSPIPVLAVPPIVSDPGEPLVRSGPLVVPIDFSAGSAAAARIGHGVARALSVPLLLVHVLAQPPGDAAGQLRGDEELAREETEAEGMLGRIASSLMGEVIIDCVVRRGSPRAEISRVALERSASLIVMSFKGQAAPVGSRSSGVVVYEVMCRAAVPVLAVPRAARHAFPQGSPSREHREREVPA